jgi:phosphoglycerol transferase MdoB-like AlkP superfamily enzyme
VRLPYNRARVEGKGEVAGAGFARFRRQAVADAVLLATGVAWLAAFRVVLLLSQRDAISPSSTSTDVATVLLNGLRFDGKIAAAAALPSFLASLSCLAIDAERIAARLRRIFGTIFVLVTVPLCVVDLFYFREYHAQFDHFVLGAVYDDLGAVLGTVWKSYPVVPGFLAIVVLAAAGVFVMRRAIARSWVATEGIPGARRRPVARFLAVLTAIVVYALVLRGSVTSRPVEERDAAVTRDPVLNELVMNPYASLIYALSDWRELASSAGLHVHLKDGDVGAAARRIAEPGRVPANLDEALRRIAPGPQAFQALVPPRHIFFVLMESDDAWTLEERWSSLHLADEMKALGREGILLDQFVSASSGTMSSLAAILTGLADAGVYTNYQPSASKPYLSSIAPVFSRLGYRTRLFYGGYLSWQRVGEFCQAQGFDEVYGAAHMGAWTRTNEWGVADEELYDFVERTVSDDVPSFDFILTTSNHPPYDIDVWEEGWPVHEIPQGMEAGFAESGLTLREIGHHAYADLQMGRFVRSAAQRFPSAVFAVTGDHYSRKFPGARPTMYERTAVPLLLYGPEALAGRTLPPGAIGSHHDIAPTLVELAAPAGFEYHAMGRSLFDPRRPGLAIGPLGRVLGPGWIADLVRDQPWERLGERLPIASEPDLASARRLRSDFLGVAWWRIRVGPDWDADPSGL